MRIYQRSPGSRKTRTGIVEPQHLKFHGMARSWRSSKRNKVSSMPAIHRASIVPGDFWPAYYGFVSPEHRFRPHGPVQIRKWHQHNSSEPLVPAPAGNALYELCLGMEISAAHLKVASASRLGHMPIKKSRLLSLWVQACCSLQSHQSESDERRLSAIIRSCVRNSFGSDKGLDHENTCNPMSADPKRFSIQSANYACPQDARSIECDWFEFLAASLGDMTIPGSSICLTASEHEPRIYGRD